MPDWTGIALRLALYLDLMLLFGLAAFPLHGGAKSAPARRPLHLAALALLGLLLSGAAFLTMIAQMAGDSLVGLDANIIRFVTFDTTAGTAFQVRMAALLLAAALALLAGRKTRWLLSAVAGTALATLAWTGHAAVTEGLPGSAHRSSDIVHLLAASAWIGALVTLLRLLIRPPANDPAFAQAQAALTRFALTGSVIVALLIVTGLVNGLMIFGLPGLALLPTVPYGRLLLAKLLLFTAMLAFAAHNRWKLTPRLAAARTEAERTNAARVLRISILLEAGAALLILALVAWLGTLAPPSLP